MNWMRINDKSKFSARWLRKSCNRSKNSLCLNNLKRSEEVLIGGKAVVPQRVQEGSKQIHDWAHGAVMYSWKSLEKILEGYFVSILIFICPVLVPWHMCEIQFLRLESQPDRRLLAVSKRSLYVRRNF